jgi:hypothetical protein
MSFVTHVDCTICGAKHDAKRLLTVCEKSVGCSRYATTSSA